MVGTKEAGSAPPKQSFTFARHETFHIRDGWLYKGLQAIAVDPLALYASDAHHNLGLGINMLRAVRYWLLATKLAELGPKGSNRRSPYLLSEVGRLIYERDTYFEDVGTLWLMHVELASNRFLGTFWYWVFNEFPQREFSEDRLVEGIQQYLTLNGNPDIVDTSLKKDALCFLRTYVSSAKSEKKLSIEDRLDSPLVQLGLLHKGAFPGQYRFRVGRQPNLPIELFEYTLLRFRERTAPDESVVSLEDMRWAPYSPGRLLGLDMPSVLDYVEALEQTKFSVQLVRTAGLNMVMLKQGRTGGDVLREYYGG